MFDFHSAIYVPNMNTESSILMKDNETGVSGELVMVVAGRLTKATPLVTPYAILNADTAGGISVKTEYLKIRKDNKYKCDVTGTGTPVVGMQTVAISSDGLSIDSGNLTTGAIEIVSYNPVKNRAVITF
ncbi:MAG TPA: hypothetical protein VIK72_19225 [Clostridiaceae bacterium]